MYLLYMDGDHLSGCQLLYPKQPATQRHLVRQQPQWEIVARSRITQLRRSGHSSPAYGFRFKSVIHAYDQFGAKLREFPNVESFEMWMRHCG
jgi:hypothetical protein